MRRFFAIAALPLLATPAARAQDVSFMKDVAPILVESCTACHNPKKSESKYDLTTFVKLMKGGAMAEGEPVLAAGKPDESFFIELIQPEGQPRMPFKLDPLPEEKRALLARWVEQGAKFDGPDPEKDWVAPYFKARPVAVPDAYPSPVPITALAFAPDNARLAVSGFHELNLWNVDGTLGPRTRPLRERIHDIAYSPDGRWVAVATGDPGQSGGVQLWAVQPDGSAKLEKELLDSSDSVFAVSFSPDGSKLAAGGADRGIRIWNIPGGEQHALIEDHADWVLDVAFSPDGSRLASASRDKTSKVFDVAKKESLVTFPVHNEAVYGVVFVEGNKLVGTCGGDGKVRIWEPDAEAKQIRELGGFGGPVFQVRLSPDGKALVACSQDKTVRVFNPADGAQVRVLAGHPDWVYALAISPDGSKIASGSWDGEVRVWNMADGALIKNFLAAPGLTAPATPAK